MLRLNPLTESNLLNCLNINRSDTYCTVDEVVGFVDERVRGGRRRGVPCRAVSFDLSSVAIRTERTNDRLQQVLLLLRELGALGRLKVVARVVAEGVMVLLHLQVGHLHGQVIAKGTLR